MDLIQSFKEHIQAVHKKKLPLHSEKIIQSGGTGSLRGKVTLVAPERILRSSFKHIMRVKIIEMRNRKTSDWNTITTIYLSRLLLDKIENN